MINKKICLILIFGILFLVSSCSKKEDEKVNIKVTDIELKDMGRIPYEFIFDIKSINDSIKQCTIRTRVIHKNDTIQSIEVFVQKNNLNIDVISSPFDFDCSDDSCFTVHDVNFNLINIDKGFYNVCTRVNYSETNVFYYNINR